MIKNIKKVFTIISILSVYAATAQQDPQYTQYMYNTMTFNPGYTGSREVISALGLYRTQWVGLEGAPRTMNFSIQSPFRNSQFVCGCFSFSFIFFQIEKILFYR